MLERREKVQWRRPVVYGLGLYFLVAGLDNFRLGSVGSLLKFLAAIPLGLSFLDARSWRLRFTPTVVALLCFWFLAAGSILYSVGPYRSWLSVSSLSMNLVMVFCLGALEEYTPGELRFLKGMMLAGCWVTVALTFLFADTSAGGRLTVMMGPQNADQNYLNGYYLYAFSWHICRLLDGKKLHILPATALMTVVLLTGSRGGVVAFLLVVFVQAGVSFARSSHKLRSILKLALGLVVLVVLFALMLTLLPPEVALRYSPDYLAEKGTTSRTEMWLHLLDHFSRDSLPRMIFGHGYGTCPLVNTYNWKIAHNLYVDNLITIGVVGLALQLCIQGSLVLLLSRHGERPLWGTQLGMMGLNLSLSLVAFKPLWNVVLLTLAIDKCAARETERLKIERQGVTQ